MYDGNLFDNIKGPFNNHDFNKAALIYTGLIKQYPKMSDITMDATGVIFAANNLDREDSSDTTEIKVVPDKGVHFYMKRF